VPASSPRRPAAKVSTQLDPSRFEVVRFEVLAPQGSGTVLALSLLAPFELSDRSRPTLVVVRDEVELLHTPRMAASSRHELAGSGRWLWRGMFPVAPDLARDAGALFSLRLFDALTIGLPAPVQPAASPGPGDNRPGRRWPYAVRRGALLFVVSCQLSLLPAIASPGALAEGTSGASTPSEVAPESGPEAPSGSPSGPPGETPSQPPAEGPSVPPPATGEGGASHPAEPPPAKSPERSPAAPAATQEEVSAQPVAAAPPTTERRAAPSGGDSSSRAPAESLSVTIDRDGSSKGDAHGGASGASDQGARLHAKHTAGRHGDGGHEREGQGDGEGGTLAGSATGLAVEGEASPGRAMEVPAGLFALPPGLDALGENPPPGYLIPIYREAGHRYGVPWEVLAAINEIETNYGRNLSVSSAGALGWMQFMPGTWAQWGVDADHDGARNPYSLDAIFAAARYLKASGAQRDLPAAVYAYNHAHWYVTEVLLRARMLEHDLTAADGSQKGYALPLDRRYMAPLGRTDDGVDIETAPDGALVYSITPGTVTAVASDPGGFGPNYPVIEATRGSLAGQHIYYGHVAASLVRPGQRVAAGQPVAVMGHTGDAVSLARGHIEIGFSDAGGDPLSHHGAEAWTPAGAVMRSFLVTLSDAFHVRNG
jgi:murein DD-endopeptidase MepM/ murein hydrolase activator NlpD